MSARTVGWYSTATRTPPAISWPLATRCSPHPDDSERGVGRNRLATLVRLVRLVVGCEHPTTEADCNRTAGQAGTGPPRRATASGQCAATASPATGGRQVRWWKEESPGLSRESVKQFSYRMVQI